MPYKVEKTVTLDGSPHQGAEVDIVAVDGSQSLGRDTTDANGVFNINVGEYTGAVFASVYIDGIKPQVKKFIPELIPYTPPVFLPDSNFSVVENNGVTTITRISGSGAETRNVISIDSVIDVGEQGVWVWEYEAIPIAANNLGSLSTGLRSTDGTNRTLIANSHVVTVDGASDNNSWSRVMNGVVVTKLSQTSIESRVYNSSGTLLDIAAISSVITQNLHFRYGSDSNINIGDELIIRFSKDQFTIDVTQGDLGAYLAVNPNWKQVGEV